MTEKIKSIGINEMIGFEKEESVYKPEWQIQIDRRTFVKILGAGILIVVTGDFAEGQGRGFGRSQSATVISRLHIGEDGIIIPKFY